MTTLSRRACWLAFATLTLGIANFCPAQRSPKLDADTNLARYRRWVKVNPKRMVFAAARAAKCAVAFSEAPSPHRDKFITVYVNPLAKQMLQENPRPHYPVGTVIVKEKYTTAKSKTPELMTVMRKHAEGYDSQNGDWEYLVMNGRTKTVEQQGPMTQCQDCHRQMASTDYVFRTPYLSVDQQNRLRRAGASAR